MSISIEEAKKYPKKTDEQRVREILEREFGKALPKKRISLGNLKHEFDLCSNDREIVGEIKSGKDLTPNRKKIKSYRFAEICLDCLYLMSVECKKKIMARALNSSKTRELERGLDELFEKMVKVPRIRHGSRQTLETLINEEALLLAKFLRNERSNWIPRIT